MGAYARYNPTFLHDKSLDQVDKYGVKNIIDEHKIVWGQVSNLGTLVS